MNIPSYSLVICGNSGTGKSSLLLRMLQDKFEEDLDPTVTGTVSPIQVNLDGKAISLNIWDTSGTDEYQAMNARHFSDAQGCIFLYALNDQESLSDIIPKWFKSLTDNSSGDFPCLLFLVGNKDDLKAEEKTIQQSDIDNVQDQLKVENSYKVSALSGEGVQDLLKGIAQKIVEAYSPFSSNSKNQKEKNQEGHEDEEAGCQCSVL